MAKRATTPRSALFAGVAAGLAGTAVMTAVQTAYNKANNSEGSDTPLRAAERVLSVADVEVPEQYEATVNNAVHWLYGAGWGAVYGLSTGGVRAGFLRGGAPFGLAVWAASLLHLPALDLAPPVWEYERDELIIDISFHLVYGISTALAFRLFDRGRLGEVT
jgi:hypothetical protein